jgi:DNA-binding MarR family transcriptional regulator
VIQNRYFQSSLPLSASVNARRPHYVATVTPCGSCLSLALLQQLSLRTHSITSVRCTRLRQQVARHGLGFTEFEVLVALRSVSPPHELTPTELYGAILISSGGLTKVMRGLESRGLVTRVNHEADGRSRPVRLTPEGRALAERMMAEVQAADGALLSVGLSPQEIECLIALLRKLLLAIEPDGAVRPR